MKSIIQKNSRRQFLVRMGAAGMLPSVISRLSAYEKGAGNGLAGPGTTYVPKVKAAFVRRKENYGMRWPGEIYDGETALRNYCRQLATAARELGVAIDIRPEPIHSLDEADAWVADAGSANADGLFVGLLDRQEHAWPTAGKASDSGIPTVVFAPIGAAFTTNTMRLANKPGLFIASTNEFGQAVYGLKMLKAGAKLREMRFVLLRGKERRDLVQKDTGTKLRYVPAQSFLDEYQRIGETAEIRDLARNYIEHATEIHGPTEQDVLNGVRSYVVARNILHREEADGITMDCLGALGHTNISLPCISWSTMLDNGIPAACEADVGACITHALVQFLFDRPGFQQDPVPETAKNCLIGAHCTCPTRLRGWSEPAEPYFLSFHHGKRDAVPVPRWTIGQRMTSADFIPAESRAQDPAADISAKPRMIISAGAVTNNVSVPPSGGCVVSVEVKLDGDSDMLAYPGFHQIFFYGDYKRELKQYSQLFGIEPVLV